MSAHESPLSCEQEPVRTVWVSVQRGPGSVDQAGLWHPTWGLWHLVVLPPRSFIPGATAACGSDVYRRNDRDVRRDWGDEVPDGKVCRKCMKARAEQVSPPGSTGEGA